MESLVGLFGKKADCEQYIKAIDHTFYGFTGVITHLGCWENTRKGRLVIYKLFESSPNISSGLTRQLTQRKCCLLLL